MKKYITILSSITAFVALTAFTSTSNLDGYYKVDTASSSVEWVGAKITGSSHEGTVSISEGGLQLTNGVISAGKFTIDMSTINVTDLEGGKKERLEGHLKNADFFDVEKFKTANISIKQVDGDKITADLTIKGITESVVFPVKVVANDNGQLTATATIEVDRSKYDVRYGSGSFFDDLGDRAIDDIIKFKVSVKAAK